MWQNIRGDEAKGETNEPHSYGHRGHLWIINVRNRRANLWEWTVILLIAKGVQIKCHPVSESQSAPGAAKEDSLTGGTRWRRKRRTEDVKAHFMDSVRLSVSMMLGVLSSPDIE